MEIITLLNKSIEEKELKMFLYHFDRETTLKFLSSLFTIKYADEYSEYVNWIQVIPGVVNAVLLFCKGDRKDFSSKDFELLAIMISAYEEESSEKDLSESVFKSYLRVCRHIEYANYVQGRLKKIFDLVDKHSDIPFKNVTGIPLEDILIPVWGTFTLGGKGEFLPLIGEPFFKKLKLTDREIEKVMTVITDRLSTNLKDATNKARNSLGNINISSSIFETKPFLEIGAEYLLMAPHFAMNDLISVCANIYISSYDSNPNNKASSIYGQAFERYIQDLLMVNMPEGELEPFYGNKSKEKGVDFVYIKKNQIPLFVEVHKAVVYRSLFDDFTFEKYEMFLKEKIIPKFRQIFRWLKSHDLKYNNLNLREYSQSLRFVVCLSTSVPLLNFDRSSDILLRLTNEEWMKTFGEPGKLTLYNVYVLGSYDIELISISAKLSKKTFVSVLYKYRRYHTCNPEIKKKRQSLSVRQDFTAWIQTCFSNKCFLDEDLKSAGDTIFASFVERCFGMEKGSWKKKYKED